MDNNLFILAAILSAIPLPMLKQYDASGNNIWIILSLISQILIVLIYIKLIKNHNINTMYPYLKIISILVVVFCGIIIFKEPMTNKAILGIMLGIISLYLLSKS